MPIFLFSGNPGSGKTLKLVKAIDEAIRAGRKVYVHGVRDLVTVRPDGSPFPWTVLEDATKWQELPIGSLVVLDEAQDVFPQTRQEAPQYVRDLSKHRHYGLDFILTTQYPQYLMKWVRDLVDRHEHHVRRWGTKSAKVYAWQEGQEDVKSEAVRARAEVSTWLYPSAYYGFYKSSDDHTIKARIPRKFLLMGVAVLCVLAAGFFAWKVIHRVGQPVPVNAESSALADVSASGKASGSRFIAITDPEAYAAKFRPVIQTQPWSAPAYQDRDPESVPRVFCMASPDRCTCVTEQGTLYRMGEGNCRQLARWGQYEPFRTSDTGQLAAAPVGSPVVTSPLPILAPASSVAGSSGDPAKVGADFNNGWLK